MGTETRGMTTPGAQGGYLLANVSEVFTPHGTPFVPSELYPIVAQQGFFSSSEATILMLNLWAIVSDPEPLVAATISQMRKIVTGLDISLSLLLMAQAPHSGVATWLFLRRQQYKKTRNNLLTILQPVLRLTDRGLYMDINFAAEEVGAFHV